MQPLRLGLLSTARINDRILAAARASELVEVVAVASRSARTAEAYARPRAIPRAYGGYEGLLADPEVDAVYVSVPNHLHVEWSIRALEAGKHVLCEKPLTASLADAIRAFDSADRQGRLLSEAFMWRHNPQTLEIERLVASGAIGEVLRIRSVFGWDLPGAVRPARSGVGRLAAAVSGALRPDPPADVRLAPALDGGALLDAGCYCVSAVRLLAGEPVRAEAGQTVGHTGVDVHFAGRLELPGGVEAELECGFAMAPRDELEVTGSAGSLFLDDPFLGRDPTIELHRDGEVQRIVLEPADSYRLELENLAGAVAGTCPLRLGRADALGQARALEALRRSAAEGRSVACADAVTV